MTGYYLYTDLPYLSRLRIVEREICERFLSSFAALFEGFAAIRQDPGEDGLLYVMESTSDKGLTKILDTAFEAGRFCFSSKILLGYNIVIMRSYLPAKEAAIQIRRRANSLREDQAVWYIKDDDDDDALENYVETEQHDGFLKLKSMRAESRNSSYLLQKRFLENKEPMERLLALWRAGTPSVIRISGSRYNGKRYTVRQAVGEWCKRGVALHIGDCGGDIDEPFTAILDSPLFEQWENLLAKEYDSEKLKKLRGGGGGLSRDQVLFEIKKILHLLFSVDKSFPLVISDLWSWPIESLELMRDFIASSPKQPMVTVIADDGYSYFPHDETVYMPVLGSDPSLALYHTALFEQRGKREEGETVFSYLNRILNGNEKCIVSRVELLPGIYSKATLIDHLGSPSMGITADYLTDRRLIVEHNGVLFPAYSRLIPLDGEEAREIRSSAIRYLISERDVLNLRIVDLAVRLRLTELYPAVDRYLKQLLERGWYRTVKALLKKFKLFGYDDSVISVWHALYAGDRAAKKRAALNAERIKSEAVLLPLSALFWELGETDKAYALAKSALYETQIRPWNQLNFSRNDGLLMLSSIHISRGDFKEAVKHLQLVKQAENSSVRLRRTKLMALAQFLSGDYSGGVAHEETVSGSPADESDPALMILFIIGRSWFEMGQYEKAIALFEKIHRISRERERGDCVRVSALWSGRCCFYMNRIQKGMEWFDGMPNCGERFFYLAEGLYFNGDPERAQLLLERAMPLLGREVRRKDYSSFRWNDGYSMIEGAALANRGNRDVLRAQIIGFFAYLCIKTDRTEQAKALLMQIIERPNSVSQPPYSYLYCYYYYLCLSRNDVQQETDSKIYLSFSASTLQKRASEIKESRMRHSFIRDNHWNKKIIDEGQKKYLFAKSVISIVF